MKALTIFLVLASVFTFTLAALPNVKAADFKVEWLLQKLDHYNYFDDRTFY